MKKIMNDLYMEHHKNALKQEKISFIIAVIAALWGLLCFLVFLFLLDSSIVNLIPTLISDFISVVFFSFHIMQKKKSERYFNLLRDDIKNKLC